MSVWGEHILLRVYLQSADRAPSIPTRQRIVKAAREQKLAGATVIRGILGVGYHGLLKPSNWSLVRHEPVIIEIVDSAAKIAQFVRGALDQIVIGGRYMMTAARSSVSIPPRGPAGADDRGGKRLAFVRRAATSFDNSQY
jgi:hypothetical protein